MREHIISWLVTDNRQTDNRVNAKVEASLNLRFAESGTKKRKAMTDRPTDPTDLKIQKQYNKMASEDFVRRVIKSPM